MADNSQDQDEMVTQFSDVTGVTSDRAKFYLEAANWTLQVRLLVHSIFFKVMFSYKIAM